MNVRVRVLTIAYRALPVHPIDPSPTPTPTTTATATGTRIIGVTLTVTVTHTFSIRVDAAVTNADSVAWWALVFIHTVRKTVHQPS